MSDVLAQKYLLPTLTAWRLREYALVTVSQTLPYTSQAHAKRSKHSPRVLLLLSDKIYDPLR